MDLSDVTLVYSARAFGDAPVVMVNLLWFREIPGYPAGFPEAKTGSRTGYYDGYVGGFRETCEQLGIEPELLHAGPRITGILAGRR